LAIGEVVKFPQSGRQRESHRGTAGPDTRLDGPVVIIEYQRSMRLLDGSHRINTWVARQDSAEHPVHIHTLKGTAKFVELPAKPS
jgi:hypothetical protein